MSNEQDDMPENEPGNDPNKKMGKARRYKDGNVDANGNYITGKYRPPEEGKFQKGDGRRRGRRSKGTKNLKTDFAEEAREKISLTENGKTKRVTKQRAIIKRLAQNASKGNNAAIRTYFELSTKLLDDAPAPKAPLSPVHQAIVDDMRRRLELNFGGAPEPREAGATDGAQQSGAAGDAEAHEEPGNG